jgi:hypothetical protein
MPNLTRRRYPERRDCWHVYYGDVCVGTIGRRAGCPVDVDQWEWGCGFYPGTEPGQDEGGTAADFEACRVEFEAAWRQLLPMLTEASFQQWRDQRDLTAWKYAMWDAHMKMPTQMPAGRSRCYCGAPIDIASMDRHALTAHGTRVLAQ